MESRETLEVLIVEPYDDLRYVFALLVETMGHSVKTASNVTEALEIVRESALNIVFAELGLAAGGSFELVKQLRFHSRDDDLALVAVTGDDKWSTEAAALSAGFDYLLTKPVTVELVSAVLQEVGHIRGIRRAHRYH